MELGSKNAMLQSIGLDISVSNIPPLSTHFDLLPHGHQCTLSDICFEKKVSEILIRTVLHFVLFDIISSLLFLKVRAKYLPVDSWMFHYSFSQFGNFQILMDCLNFFKNKIREKVSIIFNYLAMNISSDCVELQVSVQIILFSISSSVTY